MLDRARLRDLADALDLRQAEVEDLHLAARGDEDVRRLDVAVHDALGVRRFERVGDLDGRVAAACPISMRLPAHAFCASVSPSSSSMTMKCRPFVLLDRVDGADVRVIERRGGARLALEALEQLAVLGHLRRKKLQRDAAAELGVLGFVHHAHATRAQFVENLVMQEGLADEGILVHISRLIVCGGGGAVKETSGVPPTFSQDAAASLIKSG